MVYYINKFYIIFNHFFANKNDIQIQECLKKITNNYAINNDLLGKALENEYYDMANYLLAHGATAVAYLFKELKCGDKIMNQFKYLLERKAINIGYLYYNSHSTSNSIIPPSNITIKIRNHFTEDIKKYILGRPARYNDRFEFLGRPARYNDRFEYDFSKNPGNVIRLITHKYLFSNSIDLIVYPLVCEHKSVEHVCSTFSFFIENNMIDLCYFYTYFKKEVLIPSANLSVNEDLLKFWDFLKSYIHEDILVYLDQ
jgi:hypothetical protein